MPSPRPMPVTMLRAYVETGSARLTRRRIEQPAEDRQGTGDEREERRYEAPEHPEGEQEEEREGDLLGKGQVVLNLVVHLRRRERRSAHRDAVERRESVVHARCGLTPDALGDACPCVGADEHLRSVLRAEGRSDDGKHRLGVDGADDARNPLRVGLRTRTSTCGEAERPDAPSTARSARRLSLPCVTKSFEPRPSSPGVSRPNATPMIANASAAASTRRGARIARSLSVRSTTILRYSYQPEFSCASVGRASGRLRNRVPRTTERGVIDMRAGLAFLRGRRLPSSA